MRAKKLSDTAIVFLTRAAGENQDASTAKGEYYLSEAEEALIAKVTDTFAKTIVILNVGYPIDVTFAEKYAVAGLIYSGFGGMLAGPALLDILSGAVNPSGSCRIHGQRIILIFRRRKISMTVWIKHV